MYGIRSSDTGELIIKDETAGVDRYRITSAGNLVMAQNNDIIPALDNQGRIGTDTNRFASVRAVTITSGRHNFEDKFYIEEDDEGLRFHDYKTNELLMKLDRHGNLYIKGEIKRWT
jgi:hypothetical protein